MSENSAMTKYFRKLVLNTLRGENLNGFETVYVGLFIDGDNRPEIANGINELAGGGYERMPIKLSEPIEVDAFTQVSNVNEIDFGIATSDWGVVVSAGIFDSKTEGNMLYYGKLHSAKNIETGDSIRFAENQLIIGQN